MTLTGTILPKPWLQDWIFFYISLGKDSECLTLTEHSNAFHSLLGRFRFCRSGWTGWRSLRSLQRFGFIRLEERNVRLRLNICRRHGGAEDDGWRHASPSSPRSRLKSSAFVWYRGFLESHTDEEYVRALRIFGRWYLSRVTRKYPSPCTRKCGWYPHWDPNKK